MSKWKQGLMTAMEEFEEAQQSPVTGFKNVLEMEEDHRYISNTTASVNGALQSAVDLQNLSDIIVSDNLNHTSTKIIKISVEGICSRLGVPEKQFPSFEEYKQTVSLENIATRIWEAIKKAVISIYERIKNFFKNLFGFTKSAQQKNKENKERLDKAPLENPVDSVTVQPVTNNEPEPENKPADNTSKTETQPTVTPEQVAEVVQEKLEKEDAPKEVIEKTVKTIKDSNIVVISSSSEMGRALSSLNKEGKLIQHGNIVYYPEDFMKVSAETCKWLLGDDFSKKSAENTLNKIMQNIGNFSEAKSMFFNVISGLESGEMNLKKLGGLSRDLKTVLSKTGIYNIPFVVGLQEITVDIDSNTREFSIRVETIQTKLKEPIYVDTSGKVAISKLNVTLKHIEDFLMDYKGEEGSIEAVKNRVIAITKKPVGSENADYITKTFNSLMAVYNLLFSVIPNMLANVVRVGEKYTEDCIKSLENIK